MSIIWWLTGLLALVSASEVCLYDEVGPKILNGSWIVFIKIILLSLIPNVLILCTSYFMFLFLLTIICEWGRVSQLNGLHTSFQKYCTLLEKSEACKVIIIITPFNSSFKPTNPRGYEGTKPILANTIFSWPDPEVIMSKVHTHMQILREERWQLNSDSWEKSSYLFSHFRLHSCAFIPKRKALLVCEFSTSTHKWERTGAVEYMVATWISHDASSSFHTYLHLSHGLIIICCCPATYLFRLY